MRAYWRALLPLTPASVLIGVVLPLVFVALVLDSVVATIREKRRGRR